MKKKISAWTCHKCKNGGGPNQCVRPAQCEATQERLRVQADLLLDQKKEAK